MLSKCPKCDGHSFAIQENSPANSRYKIYMVQCASCGCVVGTKDYYDAGVMLVEQKEVLKGLGDAVSHCLSRINALEYELRRLATSVR